MITSLPLSNRHAVATSPDATNFQSSGYNALCLHEGAGDKRPAGVIGAAQPERTLKPSSVQIKLLPVSQTPTQGDRRFGVPLENSWNRLPNSIRKNIASFKKKTYIFIEQPFNIVSLSLTDDNAF